MDYNYNTTRQTFGGFGTTWKMLYNILDSCKLTMTSYQNKKSDSTKNNKSTSFDEDLLISLLLYQSKDVMSRAREIELHRYNLTRPQASILFHTTNNRDGLTIDELSRLTMRRYHSVSALVNRMAINGLVKKVHTKSDKKMRIVITNKGLSLYGSTEHRSTSMILSVLNEKEKQQFKAFLKKVRDRGRQVLGIDFKPPFIS